MAISRIMGFDPASIRNLGWSFVEIDENDKGEKSYDIETGTTVLPKVIEPWQVLWPLSVVMDTIIDTKQPHLIIIEKTSSFSGGFVTGQVSNCMGVILAACGRGGLPVSFVYPSHVKKVITGNGRATKSEMKGAVKKIVTQMTGGTIKFDSEHACDATANILCWMIENQIIGKNNV